MTIVLDTNCLIQILLQTLISFLRMINTLMY